LETNKLPPEGGVPFQALTTEEEQEARQNLDVKERSRPGKNPIHRRVGSPARARRTCCSIILWYKYVN